MFSGTVTEHDFETPAPDNGAADKGSSKEKGGDEKVTLTRSEFEALQRDRDEARESEKYWAGIARTPAGRAAAEPVEEEDEGVDADEFVDDEAPDGLEGDTPEKLVDELAAKGVEGLKKRGFITAKDAQRIAVEVAAKVSRQLIGRERTKISSDAQIMSEFPELKDQNSELFKETARRYQKAVALDPNARKTPAALYLAASAAKEALAAKAPRGRREEDDDRDYDRRYDREDEGDRRRRADSQDSRSRGRVQVDDDGDMIGDEAREVMRQMGISQDEFMASRKATVGTGRRTRR